MPTRPIGPGTRNLSFNAPASMAQALSRLAVLEGYRSFGELVRELCAQRLAAACARGLEIARDTRQLALPLAMCAVIAAGFLAVTIAALCDDDFAARRLAKRRRREDEIESVALMEI